MNHEQRDNIDYGSIIDRTIPVGVIGVDEQGRPTIFKDGQFVLNEDDAN